MARIRVLGGGVIGLACALRLLEEHHAVVVVDGAPGARAASWAAAGMLAPHHEVDPSRAGAVNGWRLGMASLQRWPDFAAMVGLGVGSGQAVDLAGGLIPVLDVNELAIVNEKAAWLQAQGIGAQFWSESMLCKLAPGLAPGLGAWWFPGGRVDARLLLTVLLTRVKRLGGRLIDPRDSQVFPYDITVLASGAWTPDLAASFGITVTGVPVKGQMLRFDNDGGLKYFVHCHQAYLVPRPGQGLVVGSTMVLSGFDMGEDGAAIRTLSEGAQRLLPVLAGCVPVETWTGLRPKLTNGLPFIDAVRSDLIIATGHFRNGILLAPITAELVADLVASRPSQVDRSPFQLAAHGVCVTSIPGVG